LYANEDAKQRIWLNEPLTLKSRRSSKETEPVLRKIAEGNQEDIDLLIAGKNDLILIEVKAYGPWDWIQLESKLTRIRLVKALYDSELKRKASIGFHFLLLSPNRLDPDKSKKIHWPDWVWRNSKIPWIKLRLPLPDSSILRVGRCTQTGALRKDPGDHWGIFGLNENQLKGATTTPPRRR
jgi:hypothetical protein